jgi:hypothetical protein
MARRSLGHVVNLERVRVDSRFDDELKSMGVFALRRRLQSTTTETGTGIKKDPVGESRTGSLMISLRRTRQSALPPACITC